MTDPTTQPTVEFQLSLQDKLRAARANKQAEAIESLPIPGYEGQLVAKYRSLEWRERRKIGLGVQGVDLATKELNAAADLLAASCVGLEAHVNGDVVPIESDGRPLKLGLACAEWLGLEGADSDRQAMFLIFPSELALMQHLEMLSERQLTNDQVIDQELAGN